MENLVENPFLDDIDDAVEDDVDGDETAVSDSVSGELNRPWERDYTDEERQELNRRAKAGELLPGRKKRTSAYSRRDVTEIDLDILTFLAHFKYSTDGPLATFADVKRRTVYRRMMGLREMKLVNRVDVPAARRLWLVTDKGRRVLEEAQRINQGDVRRIRPEEVTLDQLGHNLAIAQTAAWLTRGMPKFEGMQRWMSMPYSVDALVSEYKIRRGWESLIFGNKDKLDKKFDSGERMYSRGRVGEKHRIEQFDRASQGEVSYDQLFADEPSLWTLSNAKHAEDVTKEFHYPDLVINREAQRESEKPVSIALEIELTVKNKGEVARIVRMFKQDRQAYAAQVWVVSSPAVKRHIESVFKQLGVDSSPAFRIIPLFDSDGNEHTGHPWKL
jgi:DNA-binding MarR family transcriptional regulator